MLGLRIDGIEGSNDTLDTWGDRLRYIALIVLMFIIAECCGCVRHHYSSNVGMIVAIECLTGPVILEDCDTHSQPPHCKQSRIPYRRGCEVMTLNPPPKHN